MLKVRGREDDIKVFLNILEEEQNKAGEEIPSFDDLSTAADREIGVIELSHEGNYVLEFIHLVCDRLPELKVFGYRYTPAWNITTYYWSKAGSSRLETKERVADVSEITDEINEWWDKEKLYYTEEKADGSLAITGYYRWDEELYIPDMIDGKPVTELADRLFYGNPVITDIYLGESVQTVGAATFSSCHRLLLHTDSPSVRETLKKTRVMISSSDDTAEEISLKRDFVYKASGKGITLYTYRGDEYRLTVPDRLDGLEVRKIAKKAFYGKKMFSLTLPVKVTEFDPEVFEKGELFCLAAPGVDPGEVRSVIWKQILARGFILMNGDGIYPDGKIRDSYLNYCKRSFDLLAESCLEVPDMLFSMLRTLKLTPKNLETIIDMANEKDILEAKALLLDYRNNNLSEEQISRYEQEKIKRELSGPTLTELRKAWSYEILSDDTVRLTSYKGSEEDVTVPSEIEGRQVVSIREYTFVGLYNISDNAQMREVRRRRQRIKTIHIHSGISDIGECAFIGCGDETIKESDADQYYYSGFLRDAKRKKPPKITLIVESGSYAEQYAKKENMSYQSY